MSTQPLLLYNPLLFLYIWLYETLSYHSHTLCFFYFTDIMVYIYLCTLLYVYILLLSIMPYYGLFWTWSPYLDLQWRSRSTGTIPELLIISIVRHKNNNRWVGDLLWRSCELFCVVIFYSSFGLVKYPYTKQFTWSPQGIPPSPVLVILLCFGCSLYIFLLIIIPSSFC